MKIIQFTTDNRELLKDYENPLPHFGIAPTALLEGFAGMENVEIHVISCSRQEMNAPEKLAPNIFFHQPIVPHLGWGRTLFLGCVHAVRKTLRAIEPDIVHGQGTERDCAMAAVHSGYPNVLTIHGNMQHIHRMDLLGSRAYGILASSLETHTLGKTRGVFCNSTHTESLVNPRARKTWLVPNALRKKFFEPENFPKPKNDIPVLLNIGIISKLKRQLEILQMAEQAAKEHQFQIRFIGSIGQGSPYCSQFREAIDKGRRAGYADYLGTMTETELIAAMDSADAAIHFPSEEAFGLVVAEAIARGLKFFGSNLGGIVDIARGIDGAELHDDFESLQVGITRWLDAGAPAPALAADEIAKRYHPRVIAERHLEIYREVLNR
jgi:glycosyltransferase involved in cell wall biosynthesis